MGTALANEARVQKLQNTLAQNIVADARRAREGQLSMVFPGFGRDMRKI